MRQSVALSEAKGTAHTLYSESVDPQRTALLILNMNADLAPDVSRELEGVIDGCRTLLEAARRTGVRVIRQRRRMDRASGGIERV